MKFKALFIIMIATLTLHSCCTPIVMYESNAIASNRAIRSNSRGDVIGYYNSRNEREIIFRNNTPLYRVYNWDSHRYSYYKVPESHYRYIVRREITTSNNSDSYDDIYFGNKQEKVKKRNSNKHVEVDTWSTPGDENDWLR